MAWTAFTLSLVIFDVGADAVWRARMTGPFTCGRLVGATSGGNPTCAWAMQRLYETDQWFHLYPALAFMVIGYLAIIAVAVRGRRRRAS